MKYKIREITPQEMRCGITIACPSIYEITPKEMGCIAGACPSIYELTSEDMKCAVGPCPGIYENKETYLIIGEQVDPKEVGLEKKVGEGEVLIKVPKKLIDKKGN